MNDDDPKHPSLWLMLVYIAVAVVGAAYVQHHQPQVDKSTTTYLPATRN